MCCRERELCGFVHGDDFIITGESMQLAWAESRPNENLILKSRSQTIVTVTILNRLVTWLCLSGSRSPCACCELTIRRAVACHTLSVTDVD